MACHGRGQLTGSLPGRALEETLQQLPADGLSGLAENAKTDLLSAFLIFLIALPLSLGIAIGSGFPPLAGIIAAVVGGCTVSMLGGSYVTINGPAAGLIAVILGAVTSLGGGDANLGYHLCLAAIVCAGIIQIVLGVTKLGRLSAFFPATAVHGLLASIGIIIIAKQFYSLLGEKAPPGSALEQLFGIPAALHAANPDIALIGLITLCVVVALPLIPGCKKVPAPLVGVLVGVALGSYFDLADKHQYVAFGSTYDLNPGFLVTLPDNISSGIQFPDWSYVGKGVFWSAVASICIIASLETLLSAQAVEKLDPWHRKTNLDRDLTAIGVATTVSGLLGGLPMIAEIVRSSANVNAGARTRWSNFFHGVYLLLFVCLAPGLIHKIPLSSLAAILVVTGFRLASPKEFKKTLSYGPDQFAVFLVTILVTLYTDLLKGIFAGLICDLVIHLVRGVPMGELFRSRVEVRDESVVEAEGSLAFTNLLALKNKLEALPAGRDVQVDLSRTRLVDHSTMEFLEHFGHDYERSGGQFKISGLEQHNGLSGHPLSARLRRVS